MSSENSLQRLPFFVRFVATGFFSGFIPFASGTFGSLVGLLFFFIPGFSEPIVLFPTIFFVFVLGVNFSTAVAQAIDETDPSIVVIDEIVGMWITCAFLPLNIFSLSLGFFLFRVFDIFKPFPARQLESVRDGWGIMLDDVAAAIYANITARIILFAILQFKS